MILRKGWGPGTDNERKDQGAMREGSQESSPAMGGVIIGTVMMLSLAYAFGYGGQVADLASSAISDMLYAVGQSVTEAASAVRAPS